MSLSKQTLKTLSTTNSSCISKFTPPPSETKWRPLNKSTARQLPSRKASLPRMPKLPVSRSSRSEERKSRFVRRHRHHNYELTERPVAGKEPQQMKEHAASVLGSALPTVKGCVEALSKDSKALEQNDPDRLGVQAVSLAAFGTYIGSTSSRKK